MATVHNSGDVLPRRLTQLFSDNKKTYEALVQTRPTGPELSPLHLKLRVTKDRLVAWGIQWSDRSTAARAGDIDDSLDRAGISDLVASIMCSIRDLLDEAESLHPQSIDLDMSRKMGKKIAIPADAIPGEWSSANLKRLEEILKDLTTSIDTLCDLSRPRIENVTPKDSLLKQMHRNPELSRHGQESVKAKASRRPVSLDAKNARNDSPARRSDLTDMTYMDPSLLRLQSAHVRTSASPPSYESITAGSENRVLAYFSLSSNRSGASSFASADSETPVLLDYRLSADRGSTVSRPNGARFEELLLALLQYSSWRANMYTGILKLTGWTNDAPKARCAYVYEIPRTEDEIERPITDLQPRSLLAFLQNGGDADSNNIPSLDNRYRLALNVAMSLMHLHEMNVTHRNVNSNSIMFFINRDGKSPHEKIWKGPLLRKPYLTGFHQMNGSDHDATYSGIYYHPMLAMGSRAAYENVHDYYGLGLLLLEIGLWMPIGKFFKAKYTLSDFKLRLQDIYMKKLAAKCGESYMKAAMFCMTAADQLEQSHLMGTLKTPDQQKMATRFHENVIRALERCCMIDGDVKDGEIIEAFTEDAAQLSQEAPLETPTRSSAEERKEPIQETATTPNAMALDSSQQNVQTAKKIRVWSHELPDLYSKYWSSTMFPKLERILRKALSRWESYTVDLFMAGEEADTARPTVYMECSSTSKVKKILRHLNKDLRLFEIKVVSGQIVRSKASKRNKKKPAKKITDGSSGGMEHAGENLNPHYQQKPACGASIGAYLNGNHLPPVTFGGAVLINGEPYGMSVHHMLEDDEEMQLALDEPIDLRRSMAPRIPALKPGHDGLDSLQAQFAGLYPFEVSEPAEGEDASSTGYAYSDYSGSALSGTPPVLPQALYPYEIPEDDDQRPGFSSEGEDFDDEFWLDPDFDNASIASEEDLDCDMGDTDGVVPGSSASLIVTQPALDDVRDGFFPSPEDANSEHLSSHSFGHIHASSGLRRSRDDTLIHEVDWALIKINPARLQPTPHLNHPPRRTPTHSPPSAILPSSSLASRAVHTHARSSGLFARGTILPSMRLVRMPGRISPSHSWQVLGGFGGGGDSGAWVFDDATGAVCGHVLAYSEHSGVAYIAPMDVMVDDIERVTGGKVRLPGAPAEQVGLPSGIGRNPSPAHPTSPPVVEEEGVRREATVKGMEGNLMGMGAGFVGVSARA